MKGSASDTSGQCQLSLESRAGRAEATPSTCAYCLTDGTAHQKHGLSLAASLCRDDALGDQGASVQFSVKSMACRNIY